VLQQSLVIYPGWLTFDIASGCKPRVSDFRKLTVNIANSKAKQIDMTWYCSLFLGIEQQWPMLCRVRAAGITGRGVRRAPSGRTTLSDLMQQGD
jgi:hypothetical protein